MASTALLRAQQRQQPPQQTNRRLEKGWQLIISTDGESMFTNRGGTNLKIERKKVAFAVSMFPSLRFAFKDRPKSLVTPSLGAGAQLTVYRFILAVPVTTWKPGKNRRKHSASGINFNLIQIEAPLLRF